MKKDLAPIHKTDSYSFVFYADIKKVHGEVFYENFRHLMIGQTHPMVDERLIPEEYKNNCSAAYSWDYLRYVEGDTKIWD